MECKEIQERIDLLVFEDNEQSRQVIIEHTAFCLSCKTYYENSLQGQNVLNKIREHEPELSDPVSFTEEVLTSIGDPSARVENNASSKSKTISLHSIQRLLVAASVCLFVIFGIEQYVVVNKIQKLEKKMSTAPKGQSLFRAYQNVLIRYPAQSLKTLKTGNKFKAWRLNKSRYRTYITMAGLDLKEETGIDSSMQNEFQISNNRKDDKSPLRSSNESN